MKLGDGRKVTTHVAPDCDERTRLATESARLKAEWLESQEELRATPKRDSSYQRKLDENKMAKRTWDAASRKYSQHVRDHGCW